MSDFYHRFLSDMSAAGQQNAAEDNESHHSPNQEMGGATSVLSASSSYQSLQQATDAATDTSIGNVPSKPPKYRRKSVVNPGIDPVKHRRTRSGCFTCRNRRIKCDETRPACERCRKGNRDCVYPDAPAPKLSTASSASSRETTRESLQESPRSPLDNGSTQKPSSFQSQAHPTLASTSSHEPRPRQESETPSYDDTKSSSPAGSSTTSTSLGTNKLESGPRSREHLSWAHLPPDMQYYLNWYQDNMTFYHFGMLHDTDNFFKTILPATAIGDETLLNAFVGFIAYHATIQNPDGKIEDFLQYYNKSVTMLLSHLKRNDKYTIATLLTVLQLATIEEYLGDSINLLGHQKAAYEMITKMYSSKTIMKSPAGRMMLIWYSRYDLVVALTGAFPVSISRQWFTARLAYHRAQIDAEPDNIDWRIEERLSSFRLITYDMSLMIAKATRGQIDPDKQKEEHAEIGRALMEWKENWDSALVDPTYLVADFERQQPENPDDIVDPYCYGVLYRPPLISSTILEIEYRSVMIFHHSQSTAVPLEQMFAEIGKHGYIICQYFETLEFWPKTPRGALHVVLACVAIAAMFLPRDSRHMMWSRRKMATIEQTGFISSMTLRKRMAEVSQEPSVVDWWLPNEEGLTPILKAVKKFADERNAAAVTSQQEDLAEARSLFSKLEVT